MLNKKMLRAMFPSFLMIAALLIYSYVGKEALVPLIAVVCFAAVSHVIIATYNDRKARREEARKAAEEEAAETEE